MKKVFSILAIAAMFAFVSCGDKADNNDDAGAEQEQIDSTLQAEEDNLQQVEDTTSTTPADTSAQNDAENAEGGDADADGGDAH